MRVDELVVGRRRALEDHHRGRRACGRRRPRGAGRRRRGRSGGRRGPRPVARRHGCMADGRHATRGASLVMPYRRVQRRAPRHHAACAGPGAALELRSTRTRTWASNDPDGCKATPAEIARGARRAPASAARCSSRCTSPTATRGANDAVLAACAASGGRLMRARADRPRRARRRWPRRGAAWTAGARGFKLHPRSDAFALPHPGRRAARRARRRRRGCRCSSTRAAGSRASATRPRHLAAALPGARLILAHAGISDLGLARRRPTLPNLFFDTSWWQVSDLLDAVLRDRRRPRILYASRHALRARLLRALGRPALRPRGRAGRRGSVR